jgi:hypothetical protein
MILWSVYALGEKMSGALLTKNQWKWEKPIWISSIIIFCILILYPLMNGYPLVYPDSWNYASGLCPGGIRSPVLGCAMRPIVVLGGPWGFAVIQCVITAFSLAYLLVIILKRNYTYTFYLSLLTSGVGFYAGYLMADVWTLIGFICIFSISIGYSRLIIGVLLAFSYSVHYGNFPVFTSTTLLFLPFVRYRIKYILIIFSCMLGGIVFILVSNFFGGEIRLSQKIGGFTYLSSRILHDIPEVIERKCQEDPEFKLCEMKEDIMKSSGGDNPQYLTVRGTKRLNISWKEFNDLSREIVFYSLKGFFAEHISALVLNVYRSISVYRLSDGFFAQPSGNSFYRGLQRLFPDDLNDYEKSWQASGKLKRGLKMLEVALTFLFWLSVMVCFAYIGLYWKGHHNDVLIKLSIFGLIAIVVNAFFMSNISGPYGRFYTRIGFLLIFPALALISKLTDNLRKKIIIYIKNLNIVRSKVG